MVRISCWEAASRPSWIRLGTTQTDDALVYASPDNPDWGYLATVTDDGHHLVITIWKGTDDRFQILHQDLTSPNSEPSMLIEGFDFGYKFAGSIGDELYFRTNHDAPNNRLIAIDVNDPEPGAWREIIAETEDVLNGVSLVGGKLIADYMHDAHSVVNILDLEGEQNGIVNLPGVGTAAGIDGKFDDPETFFSYASFNTPTTVSHTVAAAATTCRTI